MIKLKGNTLIITGKDEKLLKQHAKEAKMPPKKFLLQMLKSVEERYRVLEKDILIERLK